MFVKTSVSGIRNNNDIIIIIIKFIYLAFYQNQRLKSALLDKMKKKKTCRQIDVKIHFQKHNNNVIKYLRAD